MGGVSTSHTFALSFDSFTSSKDFSVLKMPVLLEAYSVFEAFSVLEVHAVHTIYYVPETYY